MENKEFKLENKFIKKLLEKIKEEDWTYSIDFNGEPEDNDVVVEFYKFSPAGEDFSFNVFYKKTGNSEEECKELLKEIKEYEFDSEEHAAMWIEHRGKNGTPNSIKYLIKDADDIKEMVDEFKDNFCVFEYYTEDEDE